MEVIRSTEVSVSTATVSGRPTQKTKGTFPHLVGLISAWKTEILELDGIKAGYLCGPGKSIVSHLIHTHPTPNSLSTMPMPAKFVLPDLFSICPINGSTSPHYEAAAAESRAWVNGFNVFHGEKLKFFLAGNNELLISHAFPYAEYEQFRTACDCVNLLSVIDEVSDDQNGKDARKTGMVFLNVMRDPTWDDGSKLAQMTRECVSSILFYARRSHRY